MKTVDTSVFVANSKDRIKPESVDLGALPPIEKPVKSVDPVNEKNRVRNSERTEIRSENRSVLLPGAFTTRRRTTRYSFEFYEDQIIKLKEVKYQAEKSGIKITLSDIARDALDQYLKDKIA